MDKEIYCTDFKKNKTLILACPGSGKTTTIINNIVKLVKDGVNLDKILALTFTRKAADEMYERLKKQILIKKQFKRNVSTLHSFGFKLLDKYKDIVGLTEDYTFATNDEKENVAKTILNTDDDEQIKLFLKYVSSLKNGFEIKTEYKFTKSQFDKYCDEMINKNLIDLDDLIYLSVLILRRNKANMSILFDYIFIDEYQDINTMQNEFLQRITNENTHLMFVGDDDQSIYEFRGSNPNFILGMSRDTKNYNVEKLEVNYRSQKNIIDLSNKVIESINPNNRQQKKIMFNKHNSTNKPLRRKFNNKDQEIDFVVNEIKRLIIESDVDPREIAVISRYSTRRNKNGEPIHRELIDISNKLNEFGIFTSFAKDIGQDNVESKIIKEIVNYFKVIYKNGDFLLNHLNIIERNSYDPKRLESLVRSLKEDANINLDISKSNFISEISLINKKNITLPNKIDEKYKNKLFNVVNHYNNQILNVKKGVRTSELLENYISFKANELNTNERAKKIYEFALRYLKSVEKNYLSEEIFDVKEIVNNMALYLYEEDANRDRESIRLLTAHQSKGLQFDVVFIVGLEVGGFPSKNNLDEKSLENERRLFYVAITRARELLYLTATKYCIDGFSEIDYSGKSFIFDLPSNLFQENITNFDDIDFLIKDSDKLIDIKQRKSDLIDLQEELEISRNKLIEFKNRIDILSKNPSLNDIVSLKEINNKLLLKINDLEKFDNFNKKKIEALNKAKANLESNNQTSNYRLVKITEELKNSEIINKQIIEDLKKEKAETERLKKEINESKNFSENKLLNEIDFYLNKSDILKIKEKIILNEIIQLPQECLGKENREIILKEYEEIVLSNKYPLIDDMFENGVSCFTKIIYGIRDYNNKRISRDILEAKIKQNSFKTNLSRIVSNLLEKICNYHSDEKEFKMVPFLKQIYDNNSSMFYKKLYNSAKNNKFELSKKDAKNLVILYSITVNAGHKKTVIQLDEFVRQYQKEFDDFMRLNINEKYDVLFSYFLFINKYYRNNDLMKSLSDIRC